MAPRPKNPPPDRRQEILDAALQTFAARGYEAATNAEIARAAGVTPAALYYYFASKEELFKAALADRQREIQPALSAAWENAPLAAEPGELIPHLLRSLATFLTQERTLAVIKIVMAEGPRNPAIVAIWQEYMTGLLGPLFPLIERYMEQGLIRRMDPRLFLITVEGPILTMILMRDLLGSPMAEGISNEALVEALTQTTLRGMLTNPDGGGDHRATATAGPGSEGVHPDQA